MSVADLSDARAVGCADFSDQLAADEGDARRISSIRLQLGQDFRRNQGAERGAAVILGEDGAGRNVLGQMQAIGTDQ